MGRKSKLKKERRPMPRPWTPFQEMNALIGRDSGGNSITIPVGSTGFTKIFRNSRYTVFWREIGEGQFGRGVHLSIKRNDREPIHDWRDLQRIKNELVGPETEAVELYPRESRLVDGANQFHLWCFPDYRFPFGFEERMVLGPENSLYGSKQREFEK